MKTASLVPCMLLTLAACTSESAATATEHMPVLKHIQTFSFVEWSGKNYSFGTNWSVLRPFVDYAVVAPSAANSLAKLGVKTGFYTTVHTICDPRDYGECQPEARTLPESAFIHSCKPPYGRVMWNPEESASNPKPFYQYLGDVHSPLLAQRWNEFMNEVIHERAGNVHYDFVFEDNSMVPGDNLSWQHYYVRGSQREQEPRPYCGYTNERFMSDELHLEDQSHMPLVLNAINIPDRRPQASLATEYIPKSKNAVGAMLEYMYGSTVNGADREKEGDDIWRSEENSELAMVNGRKLFIGYPHNGGTGVHALDVRGYQYASLLLGFDQRFVALAQDGPGTRSGVGLNPEIGLVASEPRTPSPSNIEGLRNGDVYVREFARCTLWGKNIGACVTAVNPAGAAAKFPQLSRAYMHRIAISGNGVVPGVDDGRIQTVPATLPAELPAKGWALYSE